MLSGTLGSLLLSGYLGALGNVKVKASRTAGTVRMKVKLGPIPGESRGPVEHQANTRPGILVADDVDRKFAWLERRLTEKRRCGPWAGCIRPCGDPDVRIADGARRTFRS